MLQIVRVLSMEAPLNVHREGEPTENSYEFAVFVEKWEEQSRKI